jgi:hypothetical protein
MLPIAFHKSSIVRAFFFLRWALSLKTAISRVAVGIGLRLQLQNLPTLSACKRKIGHLPEFAEDHPNADLITGSGVRVS